jgi:hypothetical protein
MTSSTPSAFHGSSDLDVLAVDNEDVILRFVGGGLLRADFALEAALDGIIFEQISEIVRRNDIADGDHLDVLAHQTLFDQRPEHQASNAAEPVNCNFDCHILFF